MAEAKENEVQDNTTGERYRLTAGRASLPCSGSISPGSVSPIHQFSLKVKMSPADLVSKCKEQNSASSSDAWYISYYLYQMFTLAGLRVWGKRTRCDLLLVCNTVHPHGALCWLPPFWQCFLTLLAKVYLPCVKPSHRARKEEFGGIMYEQFPVVNLPNVLMLWVREITHCKIASWLQWGSLHAELNKEAEEYCCLQPSPLVCWKFPLKASCQPLAFYTA